MNNSLTIDDITNYNLSKNIGAKLKFLRKTAGITRQEMANLCQMGVSTLKLWENSDVEISVLKLMKYLEVLKTKRIYITVETLLTSTYNEFSYSNYIKEPESEKTLSLTDSTLGIMLLNSSKILFYADLYQKIKYFNIEYYKKITDITFASSLISYEVVNIIPEREIPKWHLIMQKIKEGLSVDYKFPVKDDWFLDLSIIPNINFQSKVIGFAAIHK